MKSPLERLEARARPPPRPPRRSPSCRRRRRPARRTGSRSSARRQLAQDLADVGDRLRGTARARGSRVTSAGGRAGRRSASGRSTSSSAAAPRRGARGRRRPRSASAACRYATAASPSLYAPQRLVGVGRVRDPVVPERVDELDVEPARLAADDRRAVARHLDDRRPAVVGEGGERSCRVVDRRAVAVEAALAREDAVRGEDLEPGIARRDEHDEHLRALGRPLLLVEGDARSRSGGGRRRSAAACRRRRARASGSSSRQSRAPSTARSGARSGAPAGGSPS